MSAKKGQSIWDKLTDSSQYTGTHKHRFDANGNGTGLAGRDRVGKGHGYIPGGGTADLSQFMRTNLHTSGAGSAHAPMRASMNSYDIPYVPAEAPPAIPDRATTPSYASRGTTPQIYYATARTSVDGQRKDIYNFPTTGPRNPATQAKRPSSVGRNPTTRLSDTGMPTRTSDGQRKGSIFDKLTDSSLYTGAHRARFDQAGYGRGKEGRTSANSYVTPYDLTTRR